MLHGVKRNSLKKKKISIATLHEGETNNKARGISRGIFYGIVCSTTGWRQNSECHTFLGNEGFILRPRVEFIKRFPRVVYITVSALVSV